MSYEITYTNAPNASFQPGEGISCNLDMGYCESFDGPSCEATSSYEIAKVVVKHEASRSMGITLMVTGSAGVGVLVAANSVALKCGASNIYLGLGLIALTSGAFIGYGAYELGASLNNGEGLGVVLYDMFHGGI
jgi:hypothetical protein